MNIIQQLEKEQVEKLSAGKTIPDFQPGDTVLVNVKVVEGDKTRVQAYEGVCIGRSGRGHEQELHRAQNFVRRGCRARVPALFADDRFYRGDPPRQSPPRQALLSAWTARQEGADLRGARVPAVRKARRLRQASNIPAVRGERAATAALFLCLSIRCRQREDWLYNRHGFQSSADCSRRPCTIAVAVFGRLTAAVQAGL